MNTSKKIIIIIIGSIIAGFGISTAIRAGFGSATLAVFWQGISKQLGITIGQSSLLVSMIMLLFILFFDRKQIHIGTVLHSIVYSFSLDFFSRFTLKTTNIETNIIIMLIGIIIFGIGVGVYASVDMGRGPYEAVCFALHKKKSWQIKYIRIIADGTFVLIGWLLGGQVGLCTIATMLISGIVIQKSIRVLQAKIPLPSK